MLRQMRIKCYKCDKFKEEVNFFDTWWKFDKPMCKECWFSHNRAFRDQLNYKLNKTYETK